MIDHIYLGRLPITYDKESAPAQKMNAQNMIKTDLNTFDCKIGQITNYSTRFFSMLCNYDRDSREYAELVERIKLLRRYIGDSIDAGKGVKTKPFPADWKSWHRVPENWDEERKTEQWFLNNLVEKRKPYFFIYIYEQTMEEYKRAKRKLNMDCNKIFGMNFNELKAKDNKTQEEKNFIKKYYKELPVTKTPCIMNKIAWKIENIEFDFKYPKNTERENYDLGQKLLNGNYKIMKSKSERIKSIYKEWKKAVRDSHGKSLIKTNDFWEDEEYVPNTIVEVYGKELEELIPNEKELADYLVKLAYIDDNNGDMKAFCWTFGGKGIIETLKEKTKTITIPIECDNGVEYLGKKYMLGEIK